MRDKQKGLWLSPKTNQSVTLKSIKRPVTNLMECHGSGLATSKYWCIAAQQRATASAETPENKRCSLSDWPFQSATRLERTQSAGLTSQTSQNSCCFAALATNASKWIFKAKLKRCVGDYHEDSLGASISHNKNTQRAKVSSISCISTLASQSTIDFGFKIPHLY